MLQAGDPALGPLVAVVATMPAGTLTLDTSGSPVRVDGDTLTIQGSAAATWPISGLGAATLELSSATLTVTSADATTASVAAVLPLSPTSHPTVGVQLSTETGDTPVWVVSLPASTSGVTPTQLIALGLGGPLPVDLPPSLDVLSQAATVDPTAFTIRFSNATGSAATAYLGFTASVPGAGWHLIPDVVDFTGLDVTAVITTGAWSVTVVGHLSIGGLPMTLGMQIGPSSIWNATLLPDGTHTFPGIVALADWFSAGTSLGPQTQSGLTGLGFDPSDVRHRPVRRTDDLRHRGREGRRARDRQRADRDRSALDLVLTLPAIVLAGSLPGPARGRRHAHPV